MPNNVEEMAEKLKRKWATGMTDYFMRELEDVLPLDQHEIVREKLLRKFEERASKEVAKKWRDEMMATSLES